MTLHQPLLMQPSTGDADLTWSGQEMRTLLAALLGHPDGFQNARGILGGVNGIGFSVAQRGAGANFSVDIPAGKAVVVGGDITNQGSYVIWNDTTFNLAVPSPGSGTEVHRVVLQVRDKLVNGTWTTYDFTPVLLPDTGSGTPAEPASAVTIAFVSVAAGQASVQNANITDYREHASTVTCFKASDTSRASTTSMTKDPDIQLNNLAAGATYDVRGVIFYTGGTGGSEGDIQYTWNTQNCGFTYGSSRQNLAGPAAGFANTDADTVQAATTGVSSLMNISIQGTLVTTASPAFCRFSWAQNSSNATNTTVKAKSQLRARRQF